MRFVPELHRSLAPRSSAARSRRSRV